MTRWQRLLLVSAEIFALTAVATTGETVARLALPLLALAGAAIGAYAAARALRARPWATELAFGTFVFALIVTGVAIGRGANLHPLVIAAHLTSSLLVAWWGRPWNPRNAGIRLALSFLSALVAASLSPDLVTSLAIFASLGASFFYLGSRFATGAPTTQGSRLVGGSRRWRIFFLSGIFGVSLVAALVIFPWLPRPHRIWQYWNLGGITGFSGELSLENHGGFGGMESGRIALSLTTPERYHLPRALEGSRQLIRGRSLELFDGRTWLKKATRAATAEIEQVPSEEQPKGAAASTWLEVQRNPINYGVLPGFRGFEIAAVSVPGRPETTLPISQFGGNEFAMPSTFRYPLRYWLRPIGDVPATEAGPLPANLQRPTIWVNDSRVQTYLKTTFASVATARPAEIMTAVEQHFSTTGGFEFAGFDKAKWQGTGFEILREFLFDVKRGHCELFATAAALTLRELGVSTRLVTGFHISQSPLSDRVWLATDKDAHAWVEAWDPDAGRWVTLDPTPPGESLGIGRFWDNLTLAYSEFENRIALLWSDQVVSYTERTQRGDGYLGLPPVRKSGGRFSFFDFEALGRKLGNHATTLFVAIIAIGTFLFVIVFSTRDRAPRTQAFALDRRMRRQQRRRERLARLEPTAELRAWLDGYERLRFDPALDADARRALERQLDRWWRAARPLHRRR